MDGQIGLTILSMGINRFSKQRASYYPCVYLFRETRFLVRLEGEAINVNTSIPGEWSRWVDWKGHDAGTLQNRSETT